MIIQMFDIKCSYYTHTCIEFTVYLLQNRKIIRTFNIGFEKVIGPEYCRRISRSNNIIISRTTVRKK